MDLTINAITVYPLSMTLKITDYTNSRSMATFQILSDEDISVGQEVIIMDGATRIFAGSIDTYTLTYLQGCQSIATRKKYNITCIDYNQICDRLLAAKTYTNQTLSYIINDIASTYLDDDGITVGTITNGDTIVDQAVFNYISISNSFDYLATAIGGNLNWNIDFYKELTFFNRSDNLGDGFTDSNVYSLSLEETRRDYRNTQLVRAGDGTTEVFTDRSPSPKPDGVSQVFNVRLPLAEKPTIKINTVAVSDSDVGINGLDTGKLWYWNKGKEQIVQDLGETPLSATDTITVSYKGLIPIIVQAENPAEQYSRSNIEGGTGIYQSFVEKRSIDDRNAAQSYANGLLVRYGNIPRKIIIDSPTYRSAGQLVNVNSSNLGINEDYLITNVTAYDFDGCGTLRYNIIGASGEDVGTWINFFKSLKQDDKISIRENEVLVLFQAIRETNINSGTVTITVSNPPVCGSTSICGLITCGGAAIETVVLYD